MCRRNVIFIICNLIFLFIFLNIDASAERFVKNRYHYKYKLGVLSYLFNTADEKLKDDINILSSELQLDQNTLKRLKDLAIYESEEITRLKNIDYKWRRKDNTEPLSSEKTQYIGKLHKKIESLRNNISTRVIVLLGENKYEDFLLWTSKWWQEEINYRNKKIKSVYNAGQLGVVACYVFATQFELDEIAVALPDKYIKFANLGWPIPEKYKKYYSNPPYKVEIMRDKFREEFEVRDVGPWNEDDNYWDLPEWLNIGNGPYRRTFDELSICMPEARAAYEKNFNNGRDQFDREVLNPAGIDLTFEAAKMLGLEYLENAWVTIFIDRLP